MTKANRIRQLAKKKKSDAEIAHIVAKEFGSCSESYVRTCARQRVTGSSESDRRYSTSSLGKEARKRFLARCREQNGCSISTDWVRRKYGSWAAYHEALEKREAAHA